MYILIIACTPSKPYKIQIVLKYSMQQDQRSIISFNSTQHNSNLLPIIIPYNEKNIYV